MNDVSSPKTTRIVFIGAPGCGKSTVAADLFVALKKMGKNAELVPEWVRRDIMKHGSMSNVFEQYRYLVHNRREEAHFPVNVEYIVQDGGILLGYFYAAVYSTKKDKKERLVLHDLYEDLLDTLYSGHYDRIYFLPRSPVEKAGGLFDDGTRFQTAHETEVLEGYMKLIFTEIHKMDSVRLVNCQLDQRIDLILKDLGLIQDIKLPEMSLVDAFNAIMPHAWTCPCGRVNYPDIKTCGKCGGRPAEPYDWNDHWKHK